MSGSFTLRRALPADASTLAELGPATFQEAFGGEFDHTFIADRMAVLYGFGRLREDVEDPRQAWFLAETGGRALGFLALAEEAPPPCVVEASPIEISRLYVRRGWYGRGPAFALMDAGLEEAGRRQAGSVWLQAWERNPRALAFYRSHGFHEAGRTLVAFGGQELPHLVLVRRL